MGYQFKLSKYFFFFWNLRKILVVNISLFKVFVPETVLLKSILFVVQYKIDVGFSCDRFTVHRKLLKYKYF